jgi:hypothetical protein
MPDSCGGKLSRERWGRAASAGGNKRQSNGRTANESPGPMTGNGVDHAQKGERQKGGDGMETDLGKLSRQE